jgi:hypothetical protein
MHVEVVRSGGFAGLREVVAAYDTDVLDREQATRLRALAGAILALPAPTGVTADGFQWETTVRDDDGTTHTVVVVGDTEPDAEPVRRLLAGP